MVETQLKKGKKGASLAVQQLGLHAFTAGGLGSILGWRTKIPHVGVCAAPPISPPTKKKKEGERNLLDHLTVKFRDGPGFRTIN